jgi:hypothetical protein
MAYTLGCACGGACGMNRRGMAGLLGTSLTPAPRTATTSPTLVTAAGTTVKPATTSTPAASSAPVSTVTPQGIIAQICTSGVGKGNCQTESVAQFTSFLDSAVSTRFLPAYTQATGLSNPNACAGQQTGNSLGTAAAITGGAAKIGTAVGTSIATSIGATAAATIIPVVGIIAGLVTSIVGIISAHHSQAVAEQDSLLCQLVPAINSALSQVDSALAAGTLSPSDASAQYSSMLSQFVSEMKSDPSYKSGDALNGYVIALQCVLAARIQDLNNGVLTGGAPGPWTQAASSSASGVVSSLESDLGLTSLPSWAPYAAAAALLALFLL